MPAVRQCISIAAISLVLCARASAQSAGAQALFNDGDKLMEQGKYAEACEAFFASNRIEPGAGTLIRLGQCREKTHQLASAWSAYKDALARARDPKKRAYAQERVTAIEPRVSHLTIVIKDDYRVEGLAITRAAKSVDSALWNRPEPIDGGTYEVVASAAGYKTWTGSITVPAENGNVEIEIPKLEQADSEPTQPPPPPVSAPSAPPAMLEVNARDRWSTRRKLAVGVGVVSIGSVATGIALGVIAKQKESEASDRCMLGVPCADAAKANELNASGHRLAIVADVLFGVAGVAALGTTYLWITGSPTTGAAIGVAGRF